MKKHLIIFLALALVAGLSFAAYAEVQNVKVSGDLTVYAVGRELYLKPEAYHADTSLSSIVRVRVDADLTDNVMATVRLLNERYWGNETDINGAAKTTNTGIDLDLAYATMKEFLYSPLTLTIGRQELRFGNAMIVGTSNPVSAAGITTASPFSAKDFDLSARKSFDAVKATLNYDPLVVDLIMAQVERDTRNYDDSTDLYGINANYALSKKTDIEGYWFERRTGRKEASQNKADQTDVLGARVSTSVIDAITLQLEAAMETGKDTTTLATKGLARKAWALEAAATYKIPKVRYTPVLTVLYGYFSGDRGKYSSSKTNTAWDPMYNDQVYGNIANVLLTKSNLQLLGANLAIKPKQDITLSGEYYLYWFDKVHSDTDTVTLLYDTQTGIKTTHKKFIGSELDLKAAYDYTEDVQFNLLGGLFFPGSGLDKANRDIAKEVIGSMKVSF